MSHTNVELHQGYSVHGTSEKHDSGKWIGSFHIAQHNIPKISMSVADAIFDSSDEAALHALRQGRLYIDRKILDNK